MVIHNVKRTDSGAIPTKKRKSARNPTSGKFESGDPWTDPELMDQLVLYVRAITDLEPLLSGVVLAYKQLGQEEVAQMASLTGLMLAELKQSALLSLSADPESRKEVKKKRIDAQRLGNVPMAEMQRINGLANEWLARVPVTPAQLLKASPVVVDSIMKAVAPLLLRSALPLALPTDVEDGAMPSDVMAQLSGGKDGVS
jgi:hypothetical protein